MFANTLRLNLRIISFVVSSCDLFVGYYYLLHLLPIHNRSIFLVEPDCCMVSEIIPKIAFVNRTTICGRIWFVPNFYRASSTHGGNAHALNIVCAYHIWIRILKTYHLFHIQHLHRFRFLSVCSLFMDAIFRLWKPLHCLCMIWPT